MRNLSYRVALGLAGLFWICVASTLCGCTQMNGAVMNASGKSLYEHGNYTAARHDFERALIDNPWNADYAHNVAAASQKQGDLLAAERMYQHALTLDPSHQPSYHGLAAMLRDQGREVEATELLQSWTQTQPTDAEAHLELAWHLQKAGDLAGAEQSLQNALRINPRQANALAQLGDVYEHSGRSQEAAALYRRSLALNGNQPQVKSRVAGLTQPSRFSPAMQMATLMPQADPTLRPAYATPAAMSTTVRMMPATMTVTAPTQQFAVPAGAAPGFAPHGQAAPPANMAPPAAEPHVQLGSPVPVSRRGPAQMQQPLLSAAALEVPAF